jgi:tetratricopeptide (TPR) repeat protein
MNTEQLIVSEVSGLVGHYCGAGVLSSIQDNISRAGEVESALLSNEGGERRRDDGRNDESSTAQILLEALLTGSKRHLTPFEYRELLLGVSKILSAHGEFRRAEQTLSNLIALCDAGDYPDFVAEALLQRGELLLRQGRWHDSHADLQKSREIFRLQNDIAAVARIENILGTGFAEQGLLAEATAHFSKALENAEMGEQRVLSATILMNIGIVQNIIGNSDEALKHLVRALSLMEAAGDATKSAEVLHNLGMTHLTKADFEEAYLAFDKSLEYSTALQNPGLMGLAKLGKANVCFRTEELRLSLELVNQALRHFEATSDVLSIADSYKVKGMILRERGEYDLARTYFELSIRINEEHACYLNLAETLLELGLMEKNCEHKSGKAGESLRLALHYFRKVGAAGEIIRTTSELHSLGD